MPGENREQARGECGDVPGRRESSRGEADVRNPRGPTATMIPLPRTGQFAASASQNQKVAKTEKNRLRLIMESRGTSAGVAGVADVVDKERRVGMRDDNRRVATILRFREELGDSHRDDKVIQSSDRCIDEGYLGHCVT